jgi:hypothetical protein
VIDLTCRTVEVADRVRLELFALLSGAVEFCRRVNVR